MQKLTAISAGAVLLALASAAVQPAQAKGCIKGAIVGGIAGHYAGHHGLVGAAAGCVAGHELAKKKDQQNQRSVGPYQLRGN
jgi:hypothetical protein